MGIIHVGPIRVVHITLIRAEEMLAPSIRLGTAKRAEVHANCAKLFKLQER